MSPLIPRSNNPFNNEILFLISAMSVPRRKKNPDNVLLHFVDGVGTGRVKIRKEKVAIAEPPREPTAIDICLPIVNSRVNLMPA